LTIDHVLAFPFFRSLCVCGVCVCVCVVSQFIYHINTVRYRTVQFSMNTVPNGQCSLVRNYTT